MKLHLHNEPGLNIISAYGPDHVFINRQRHDGSLIVTGRRIVSPWVAGDFDSLAVEHLRALAEVGAEVVLLGTGSRQRFPHPSLLRPLIEARIGFEVMDLAAACRTYNILVGEGRSVAVALIFDPPA